MKTSIPLWDIPSLPVVGSDARFPIRRVFCVGRNYVEHQKEMGGDGREQPFFFAKAAHDVVPIAPGEHGQIHYAPMTADLHWETEMVVALGKGGFRIALGQALEHVYGYGVGLDMTRRDLQQVGKDKGRPWTFGKDFDQAAPMGALTPAASIGHLTKAGLKLTVNGQVKQDSNIDQMIWNVAEQIEFLSRHYTLEAGDLIMTGTPAGVGAAKTGDVLHASIDGLANLKVSILPPK